MHGKFQDVVLERDGEEHLDRSCEKWRRIKKCEARILRKIKRRKDIWIGHILRRNCLIKHVIEGMIEETRRRGIRRKQLLNDFMEKRRYWNFKEGALSRDGGLSTEKRLWTYRKTDYVMSAFVRSFSPFLCCSPLQETNHKES